MEFTPKNSYAEVLKGNLRHVPSAVGSAALRKTFIENAAQATAAIDQEMAAIDAVLEENTFAVDSDGQN